LAADQTAEKENNMIRIRLQTDDGPGYIDTTRHTCSQVLAAKAAETPILVGGPEDRTYAEAVADDDTPAERSIDPAVILSVEEVPA
jgi:hypothetical protein